MSSARALTATGLLAAALALGACGESIDRPGVVLIVVDTLRADVVPDGAGRYTTPHVDALAADGVVFPSAFSHAPMTLPAHTSLFSSRPPFETGILNNGQELSGDLPLLAEWLAKFGYDTHAVISLGTLYPHIAIKPDPKKRGIGRGFDSYDVDFWHIAQAPDVMTRLRGTLDEIDPDDPFLLFAHFCDPHEPYNAHGSAGRSAKLLLDGNPVGDAPLSDMTLTEREVELAAGAHTFAVRSKDAFRMRGFQLWHGKKRLKVTWEEGQLAEKTKNARIAFEVPEQDTYTLKYWINDAISHEEARARYAAEVEYVDGYVGELLDELRARGLYDDNWIVFTSDHGEALGERGLVGHVQNLHDELIQVPLVIKPPAGDPQAALLAESRERLTSHADLTATLLELLQLPGLPGQRGISVLEAKRPVLIAQTHEPEAHRTQICLRDERFKMVYAPDEDSFELYDLEADPGETKDVYTELGHERADWVDRLRGIARIAAAGGGMGSTDAETAELLRALGYGG